MSIPNVEPTTRVFGAWTHEDQGHLRGWITGWCLVGVLQWWYGELRHEGWRELAAPTWAASEYRIELNRARWPELAIIPEIGEELARRIVRQREMLGRFERLEEVLEVSGIGPKKLAVMREYLCVSRPATNAAEGCSDSAPIRPPSRTALER